MKSILLLIVFVLLVNLNQCKDISSTTSTFQSKINEIIDSDYQLLFEELKSSHSHLRDYKEGSVKHTPLPSYKCQHDHHIANDMTSEQVMRLHDQQRLLRDYQGEDKIESVSTKSLRDANADEIGNIRITFDTSLLGLSKDAYACSSTGQVVKVDSTGSISKSCVTNRDAAAVSPCNFSCTNRYIVSDSLVAFIKKYLLGTINKILVGAIELARVQGNLKLEHYTTIQECHYGVPINTTLKTVGVPNSDYYVFVTSRPTSDLNTIAYAKACVYPYNSDVGAFGRPIAGVINFNPDYFFDFINSPSGLTFNEYVRVGLHEMIHALGFSKTFYAQYIDSTTGQKYDKAVSNIYSSGTTPSGVKFTANKTAIVTPSVTSFARAHYNCKEDFFNYQELEDSGGAGTASSHWERRSAGEELMLGYVQPMFPLTNLTLSLLQDTGWYRIDYSASEQLLWGKNLGCSWIKGCSPTSWNFPGYFCSSQKFSCSPTRNAKGVCYTSTYTSDLPYPYQHFTNPRVGGDSISDFCPFSDYANLTGLAYCQDTAQQSSAVGNINEVFGPNSKCFDYTANGYQAMGCLQQRCAGNDYEIYLGNSWKKCPSGQSITFTTNSVDYDFTCPTYYYPCLPVGVPVPEISSSLSLSFNYLSLIIIVILLLLLV